jgi:MFS family permease
MIQSTAIVEPARPAGVAPRGGALCLHAFTFAIAMGMALVALPFAAIRLGADPWLVGIVGGAYSATYMAACLLGGPFVDHVRPRTLILLANTGYGAVVLVMATTEHVAVLGAMSAAYGILQAGIWPPLVGWLSCRHHGRELNRRLGWFNVSWCSGMVVGPLIGGALYEWHPAAPFVAAAVVHVANLLIITLARAPQPGLGYAHHDASDDVPGPAPHPNAATYRLVSRIALVVSFMAIGMHRFVLPPLARALQIREAVFGAIIFTLFFAMSVAFGVLGRTDRWHYRASILLGAQLLIAGAMGSLAWARSAWHLGGVAAIAGAGVGVAYSSALYYAVAGGRRRGGLMAVHEMLLSVGIMIGAFAGGYVSGSVGVRAPFPAYAAVLIAAVVLEAWILRRSPRPRAATAAPETEQVTL